MRSNIRRMALCFIAGVVITTAPVHDTFAVEPATSPTPTGSAPTEPSTPAPSPEGSSPPPEAGDIQERGLGLLAPGIQPSGTLSLGDRYHAPTPNLNAVANAIRVTSRSLSVHVLIPANLPVTVPVEISIAYTFPVEYQRLTKTYNPATGLNFLNHGIEGDGNPRTMRLDITMSERVPNGKSFTFSNQLTLIPLYDVFISALRFYMRSQCDLVGKSDITFRWRTPEGLLRIIEFKLGLQGVRDIPEFASSHREISTQANLTEPVVQFLERDPPPHFKYKPPIDPSRTFLVPGSTNDYSFYLSEGEKGPPGLPRYSSGCQAEIRYKISRTLLRG